MNIEKIPITPIRWFKRKPNQAASVVPKGESVGVYGKSGIVNSQEDSTVPPISKVAHPNPGPDPLAFVPGTEAIQKPKTIGLMTPTEAIASGATSIEIHSDGS